MIIEMLSNYEILDTPYERVMGENYKAKNIKVYSLFQKFLHSSQYDEDA
ncbi:MAG: hypothetical protein P8X73_02855 [Ignavibacteriaceae bacterium]